LEHFPFDPVIFTGRITEEELREERPAEYERMLEEGSLEAQRAEPPPLWLRNLSWIVGMLALLIGLGFIGLIFLTQSLNLR